MATQERVTDLRPLLNHECIIGILIYAVMRDILFSEIVELARSVPKDYYDSLDDNWDTVGYFIHANLTFPLEERSLQYVQDCRCRNITNLPFSRGIPPKYVQENIPGIDAVPVLGSLPWTGARTPVAQTGNGRPDHPI